MRHFRDPDVILKALSKAEKEVGYKFLPMVDKELIVSDPLQQALRGEFNKNNIEYMIGVTSDEGYWYQKREIPYRLEEGIDMIEFEETIRKFFKKETAFKDNYEQIMGIIRTEYGHCDNDTSRSKGLTDAFGEYSVIAPSYRFAHLLSKYSSNVYFYEFAHRPPHWESPLPGGSIPDFVHASHYADINYVFGDVRCMKTDPDEQALSLVLAKMWANFAKYG